MFKSGDVRNVKIGTFGKLNKLVYMDQLHTIH